MQSKMVLCGGLLLLALTWGGHRGHSQERAAVERAHIEKLIQRLGSTRYVEREKAARELTNLGPAALELLRQAAEGPDLEISRRAVQLVQSLEEKTLAATVLVPKKLRLAVKDLPVSQAVAELARLSGYKVQLGEDAVAIERKVTLDTGETTFWEALEQLCQAAKLVEASTVNRDAEPRWFRGRPWNRFGGRVGPLALPMSDAPPMETITLAEGAPRTLPTHLAGSVRVRLTESPKALKGEILALTLEAAGEPRLKEFRVIGPARIERAVDDRGQALAVTDDPTPAPADAEDAPGNNVIIINGRVIPATGSLLAPEAQRTAKIHFKKGEKPARTLAELSGRLNVQMVREIGPMVTVDNVVKTVGTLIQGKDHYALQLHSVAKQDNGDVKVEATVIQPTEPSPAVQVRGVVMQVRGNVRINGAMPFTPASQPRYPRLSDAGGREYEMVEVSLQGTTTRDNLVSHVLTLVYRSGAEKAEPARLVLFGQGSTSFWVPFTLKNVPLP